MSKLFSKEVAEFGKVYALDSNTHFIETLKKEVKGTNIETIEGDITKPTKLAASSIDFIYRQCFTYFPNTKGRAFCKR